MTHVNIVHHTGHHKVINRNDKTFIVEINGKTTTVSIDSIKPAFMVFDSLSLSLALVIPPDCNAESPTKIKQPIVTRSGRHVHFPKRFITVM